MVERDPRLPTFCSINLVVPSGRVNSTAVMSPSISLPVHLSVTVNGAVPLVGFKARSVHTGAVLLVSVGVLVGVAVGVLVGVPDGVPVLVGVGVFAVMLKDTLHALLTAFGVTCGTFGATDDSLSSLVDVKYATTPTPTVMMVTAIKYQYFFKNFIY